MHKTHYFPLVLGSTFSHLIVLKIFTQINLKHPLIIPIISLIYPIIPRETHTRAHTHIPQKHHCVLGNDGRQHFLLKSFLPPHGKCLQFFQIFFLFLFFSFPFSLLFFSFFNIRISRILHQSGHIKQILNMLPRTESNTPHRA